MKIVVVGFLVAILFPIVQIANVTVSSCEAAAVERLTIVSAETLAKNTSYFARLYPTAVRSPAAVFNRLHEMMTNAF